MKKYRAITPATVGQTFYLTLKYFFKNRLLSYAGSCSFSFIFSFVPILMMIFMILIRVLHASPETVEKVTSIFSSVKDLFPSGNITDSIQHFQKINFFTVLLGFMVLWMGRRFLASILDGMQNIFHAQQERKDAFAFILAFIVAIIIVLAVSLIIFLYVSGQALLMLNTFDENSAIGKFLTTVFSAQYAKILPNILLLIILTIIYRIGPGTRPKLLLSFASSLMCTAVFWIFRAALHYILSIDSYNMIYGVLGSVIITLMDVFFFFMFFMFFAQFIFTCQFFDELLMGELYLLPKKEIHGIGTAIRRSLFIRPDYLIAKLKTTSFAKGDTIYNVGDQPNQAYYITKGKVILKHKTDTEEKFSRGDFFGEVGCVINKQRDSHAYAYTDVELIIIDGNKFQFLVEHNHDAAHKALGQISSYFTLHDGTQNLFHL